MSLLAARYPSVWVSVSATTRAPRPTETDGVHYLFLSDAEFDDLVEHDGLLEWAIVHGRDRYGTPAAPVRAALADDRDVILEIDIQGARQVRQKLPDARYVFMAPPDWDTLVGRLRGRGTETEEQMRRRLATARDELASASEFDHIVINGDLEETVSELVDLLGLEHIQRGEGIS